jgi:hypothetical protein
MEISKPPKININKKGAHTFVLSCIDPRFTEFLAHYLINHQEVKDDYDYFTLAGASLGANHDSNWKKLLCQHIDIALKLHKITEFWAFDHMDCGMYKVQYKIKKDEDPNPHIDELNDLHTFIRSKYPQLDFRGFIMDKKGGIHQVI